MTNPHQHPPSAGYKRWAAVGMFVSAAAGHIYAKGLSVESVLDLVEILMSLL